MRKMKACQDYSLVGNRVASSHAAKAIVDKVGDEKKRRELWEQLSMDVNDPPASDT